MSSSIVEAKAALRHHILARRMSVANDADVLARTLLSHPRIRAARTVGAFWPLADEPDLSTGIHAMVEHGIQVALPVVNPDRSLGWRWFRSSEPLQPGRHGTRHPDGPALTRVEIQALDVLLVPALAVDPTGNRLGRGGGSYDRTLAQLGEHTWRVAVVHPENVITAIPTEAHDQPVQAILTAQGWHEVP